MNYVSNELEESLQQRIQKLATGDTASALMQRIEQVVTSQGLVEFRPRIDTLLARLENPTFEVAVFGRVSSGKSSFLNALLGMDMLPVGTNPITAVPTRIQYGPDIEASIRFGNGKFTDVSLDRFRELISESGNPGNAKGVTQALLRSPAVRLAEGIVLVDTPGLGSLAIRGTRETLAYLPSCDLALLLVDGGNTLTIEDIGTLRLIHEAGIPALVLLSKADLLRVEDRLASVEYIKSQVQDQLRIAVPVHPISSLRECASMIDQFYEKELLPRFQQSHTLRLQSVNTKLARLQADVVASLEVRVQRLDIGQPMGTTDIQLNEKLLMDAAGRLGTVARTLEDRILHLGAEAPEMVAEVAGEKAGALHDSAAHSILLSELLSAVQRLVQAEVGASVELLQQTVIQAVHEIHTVGEALKRSSLPDEKEIVGLIRDAPHFEPPVIRGSLEIGFWRFLGKRAIRRRLLRNLRSSVQPAVHKELRAYSSVLGVWAKGLIRSIQFSVNSFADLYRASLQEMGKTDHGTENAAQIRHDIAVLTEES